jgi:DNA recombination-dependent growth factor C
MDQPPKDYAEAFEKGVRAHALVPLDPKKNPTEERAIGWCSLHDSEDLDLDFEKFFLDGRILLSLRVDTIKPPAGHVRRILKQRLKEAEAERGSPLPKAAVRDLKEHIVAELRKHTPPKVRVTDVVWNLDAQSLYFFSHSKGTNELFVDLFVQTFGIPLDFEGPGPWAAEIAEEEGLKGRLQSVKPTEVLMAGFTGLRPGTRDVT